MPTAFDYELAADKFETAAAVVGELAALDGAAAAQILRGGSLGYQVPARITEAAATAQTCQRMINEAAELCRYRSVVLAEYEALLAEYVAASEHYEREHFRWRTQNDAYFLDSTGEVQPPAGSRPVAPVRPTKPSWLEGEASSAYFY